MGFLKRLFPNKRKRKWVEVEVFPKWVDKKIKKIIETQRSPPYPCVQTIIIKGENYRYKYKRTCHQHPSKEWLYKKRRR